MFCNGRLYGAASSPLIVHNIVTIGLGRKARLERYLHSRIRGEAITVFKEGVEETAVAEGKEGR